MKKIFLLTLFSLITIDIFACTSAIFTGRVTKDGRPLMWKNRDTDQLNNRIEVFKGPRYSFTALVNSPDLKEEAWAGSNEVGFCIMNTASYNLAIEELDEQDGEGALMFKALGICRTTEDFENLIDSLPRPMPIEANFGVIDAIGGAAYYEVNSREWKKIDVTDPNVAPRGYVVYTNYSFTGRKDEGMGYIRYTAADKIIKEAIEKSTPITPEWIMESLSRSFYHPILGIDLRYSDISAETNGWFIDQDFIPRKSTSAVSIFQGVNYGEDPSNTIYWVAIGYPPLAVMIPIFTRFDYQIPNVLLTKSDSDINCEICDLSLERKELIFPIKRGNGSKYFRFGELYNNEGTGYAQQLSAVEEKISKEADVLILKLRQGSLTKNEVTEFNNRVCEEVEKAYRWL